MQNCNSFVKPLIDKKESLKVQVDLENNVMLLKPNLKLVEKLGKSKLH